MENPSQVCYVVVGKGWDHHSRMAWLSAQSVRIQQPRLRIVFVIEGTSATATEELRSRFANVGEVLVKTSEVSDPVAKSRFHRIAMRDYVSGDLLYVDSDTLAIAPFADVFGCVGDVGAAIDFNGDPSNAWCPPDLEEPFNRLGWTYPVPRYRNAGVFLLRDTAGARTFCDMWLSRWRLPPEGSAHTWDQATFNSALVDSGVSNAVLATGYNAMVVKRNYRFGRSRILHFFGSPDEQRGTLMAHLLEHLQATGEFDRGAYDRCIRQRHPWGPNPAPWQLRHSRNYVRATIVKAWQAFTP